MSYRRATRTKWIKSLILFGLLAQVVPGHAQETIRIAPVRSFGGLGADVERMFNLPSDLLVTQEGNIVISDSGDNQVVILDRIGNLVKRIGRRGQGPSEFNRPGKIGVLEDNILVYDAGNSRIQLITKTGKCLAVYRARTSLNAGIRMWFHKDGTYYFGTDGFNSSFLISRKRLEGDDLGGFGRIYGDQFAVYDFRAAARARNGELPDWKKNAVIPLVSALGEVYCVHTSLPLIRKFSRTGEQLWEKSIDVPEMAEIRDRWIQANRNAPPNGSYGLSYWLDADLNAEGDLFLLSDQPGGMVIYRYNHNGDLKVRYFGIEDQVNMISLQGTSLWAFGEDSHKLYEFKISR